MTTLLLGTLTACVIACVMFFGFLPRWARRSLAFAAIGVGLVFLMFASGVAGDRTTRLRALFLHHHCVVDEPTAPAAALPLLLGTAALVGGALGLVGGRSRRLGLDVLLAIATSIAVLRYGIDKAAAPEPLAHAVGVTWMIPALGVYAAMRLRSGVAHSLPWDLLRMGLLVRVPALLANLITTRFDLGSHYSLVRVERIAIPFVDGAAHFEPQSLDQFMLLGALPQLIIWPLISLAVAYPCAKLTLRMLANQPSSPAL